ncbi:hypothetical protein GCM10027342_12670 [Photobacterium alginatilyticum]
MGVIAGLSGKLNSHAQFWCLYLMILLQLAVCTTLVVIVNALLSLRGGTQTWNVYEST